MARAGVGLVVVLRVVSGGGCWRWLAGLGDCGFGEMT